MTNTAATSMNATTTIKATTIRRERESNNNVEDDSPILSVLAPFLLLSLSLSLSASIILHSIYKRSGIYVVCHTIPRNATIYPI